MKIKVKLPALHHQSTRKQKRKEVCKTLNGHISILTKCDLDGSFPEPFICETTYPNSSGIDAIIILYIGICTLTDLKQDIGYSAVNPLFWKLLFWNIVREILV